MALSRLSIIKFLELVRKIAVNSCSGGKISMNAPVFMNLVGLSFRFIGSIYLTYPQTVGSYYTPLDRKRRNERRVINFTVAECLEPLLDCA